MTNYLILLSSCTLITVINAIPSEENITKQQNKGDAETKTDITETLKDLPKSKDIESKENNARNKDGIILESNSETTNRPQISTIEMNELNKKFFNKYDENQDDKEKIMSKNNEKQDVSKEETNASDKQLDFSKNKTRSNLGNRTGPKLSAKLLKQLLRAHLKVKGGLQHSWDGVGSVSKGAGDAASGVFGLLTGTAYDVGQTVLGRK